VEVRVASEELLDFPDREAWRDWLEEHHDSETEAWVVHQKKASTQQGLRYEEGVEEALCFGWIDGVMRRIDDLTFMQRYSPRKPKSVWSASNVERVERLIAEGRMTPAGMALVEEAKRSGWWDSPASNREPMDAPPELEQALRGAGLWEVFGRLPNTRRNRFVWMVEDAKRPSTKESRIERVLHELGETEAH
jgi:uncharacterized protein YdeI (YjbR/CyaY-like superfamily)